MKNIAKIYGLLLVCWFSTNLHAQISEGGIPEGFKFKLQAAETVELSIPLQTLAAKRTSKLKKLNFGFNIPVKINPDNMGRWQEINGEKIWTIIIRSKGARSLSLTFENFQLKKDEKLFVYNNYTVLGAFTESYNKTGILNTQHISGDSIIVEFSSPNAYPGSFTITNVVHAYLGVQNDIGSCNININCPVGDDWQKEKRAVAKITIQSELCTGTLINNTANDGKAYLLTAHHCISDQYFADRALFIFNYESPGCNNTNVASNHVISGARILSTNYDHDYTLLELNQHPPISFLPYYAGWNTEKESKTTDVRCIHHPNGAVKKMAIEHDTVTRVTAHYFEPEDYFAPDAFWMISRWDQGTTEGGSSGAALFDKDHYIIGSLTGGRAECSYPDSDFFSQLSESYLATRTFNSYETRYYDSLITVLDPLKTNIKKQSGYDPYNNYFTNCDTLSNIFPLENVTEIKYEFGTGYYSGHNSDRISSYAEQFNASSQAYLYGAQFNITKSGSQGGIIISVLSGKNGPDSILFEKYISLSLLGTGNQFIEFYPAVPVKDNYYISYSVYYENSDTFAIAQAPFRSSDAPNTAWIKSGSLWLPFNSYTKDKNATSFDIKVSLCTHRDSEVVVSSISDQLKIYPNPVSSKTIVEIPIDNVAKLDYQIIDISGKIIATKTLNAKNIVLDLSNYTRGFYIIFVSVSGKTYEGKILKY